MTSGRPGPIDDALVQQLVEGSEAALGELYDRHASSIFALAYRLTSDRGVAEEVVQETFLALWNRAETFDPASGSLTAWLHAIARNRSIDRLRAAGRRPALVGLSMSGGTDDDTTAALDRLVAGGAVVAGAPRMPDPEAAATMSAFREAVGGLLQSMPEAERTVILLAYQEELSQTEIADRLGWPLGTVKTRTRRALLRLREGLGPAFAPAGWTSDLPVGAGEDR